MGTTYKGLYEPATSETNWTATVNGNFTALADGVGKLFLPASTGFNQAGAGPIVAGTFPNQVWYFALADGVSAGAVWLFQFPSIGQPSATFTVRPYWYAAASDNTTAKVRWQMDAKNLDVVAGGVLGAGTTIAWTGDAGPHLGATPYFETGTVSTGLSVPPANTIRLAVQRIGADAADGYAGEARLLGVQLSF